MSGGDAIYAYSQDYGLETLNQNVGIVNPYGQSAPHGQFQDLAQFAPYPQGGVSDPSSQWLEQTTHYLIEGLNQVGYCVIDKFLGTNQALEILNEVQVLHSNGVLSDGQVVSQQVHDTARGMIRGDKITWVTGREPQCQSISKLVNTIDSVVAYANRRQHAGRLRDYNITSRTKAMVACYPGDGSRYVKHIDNPDGNGRCITAIYYLNPQWRGEHGGNLRIYPAEMQSYMANIVPQLDRMLFFWSDRRNPHEVLPSARTRYAITVWYLDQKECIEYQTRCPK